LQTLLYPNPHSMSQLDMSSPSWSSHTVSFSAFLSQWESALQSSSFPLLCITNACKVFRCSANRYYSAASSSLGIELSPYFEKRQISDGRLSPGVGDHFMARRGIAYLLFTYFYPISIYINIFCYLFSSNKKFYNVYFYFFFSHTYFISAKIVIDILCSVDTLIHLRELFSLVVWLASCFHF